MLGLGVMINVLGGNKETVEAIQSALNKKITSAELRDNALKLSFEDGSRLSVYDGGQSCCETRWMSTDDDLEYYEGATLLKLELADAPSIDDKYVDHEVQFLHVTTSKGVFTMQTHNEHNGYYGGFWIQAAYTRG